MKFFKLSLAASVALGAFSTASFAQPLEEAIKGVDVKGYLRYRYTDDRYDNEKFVKNDKAVDAKRGSAKHQWKAQADFKTPTINNVALNFGLVYDQNVITNHGKGAPFLSSGLGGAKGDGFGVSVFNATVTPDSTATTILAGKQRFNTPVTGSDDRGTGIFVTNRDIPGLTLVAGAFDAWRLDDAKDLGGDNGGDNSVAKPFYTLAAEYNADTGIGNIGASIWGFTIEDIIDSIIFTELSWKGSLLSAKVQYGFSKLDDSKSSVWAYSKYKPVEKSDKANIATDNDLLTFQLGANFKDFNLPLELKAGYLTNFQDGLAVSLDNGGKYEIPGKIWSDNAATSVNIGLVGGATQADTTQEIDVFYGSAGYSFIDNRLKLGLDAVFGKNDLTQKSAVTGKIKFTEITPTISWKYNSKFNLSAYYAMLSTENSVKKDASATKDTYADEDRNRLRLEARYSF